MLHPSPRLLDTFKKEEFLKYHLFFYVLWIRLCPSKLYSGVQFPTGAAKFSSVSPFFRSQSLFFPLKKSLKAFRKYQLMKVSLGCIPFLFRSILWDFRWDSFLWPSSKGMVRWTQLDPKESLAWSWHCNRWRKKWKPYNCYRRSWFYEL